MTSIRTPELTALRGDDSRPDRVGFGQGAGVTIAVIDDAIDTRHPEFEGRVCAGYDVSTGGDSTLPDGWQPHGTKVAGLALAGGIRVTGVASQARLMPVRVPSLAKHATGGHDADAIRWAAEQGADVICCAWAPAKTAMDGGRLPERTREAIDWALEHGRRGKGCVVVFATGNSGGDLALNGYASHPGVIAVGACNYRGRRPSYSGWGAALTCVVLSNDPRDRIGARMTYTTTTPLGSFLLGETLYTTDFGFTSAACAIAAGVCARILAADRDQTWQQVREALVRSCHRIDADGGLYDERGHSPYYGFGRLDPASTYKNSDLKLLTASV